jgi:hypothetical protein
VLGAALCRGSWTLLGGNLNVLCSHVALVSSLQLEVGYSLWYIIFR